MSQYSRAMGSATTTAGTRNASGIAALLLLLAAISLRTDTAKRMVLAQAQKFLAKQGVILEAENFEYRFRPFEISDVPVSPLTRSQLLMSRCGISKRIFFTFL